jgi:ribosomal protein S17E
MVKIIWNKELDAYKDISFDTNYDIGRFHMYVELRLYPGAKGWRAVALFTEGYGEVRRFTLKKGSYEDVEKYLYELVKDQERSKNLLDKLMSKLYFKGKKFRIEGDTIYYG